MTITPMDCKAVETVPREDNLIYELKWDGTRLIVIVRRNGVEIHHSESPNVVNFKYPELVPELQKLSPGVYDGELCVLDSNGFSDFSASQARAQAVNRRKIQINAEKYPVKFMVFDLLETEDGESLRTEYLIERKKKLEQRLRLLKPESPIKLVPFYQTPDDLERLYGQIEGIVIKGMYSIYEEGKRSGAWRKKRFNQEKTVKAVAFEEYTRDGRPAGITLITEDGRRINLPGNRAHRTKEIIESEGYALVDIIYYDETPDGYRFPRVNQKWEPVIKRITDPETKRGIEEP